MRKLPALNCIPGGWYPRMAGQESHSKNSCTTGRESHSRSTSTTGPELHSRNSCTTAPELHSSKSFAFASPARNRIPAQSFFSARPRTRTYRMAPMRSTTRPRLLTLERQIRTSSLLTFSPKHAKNRKRAPSVEQDRQLARTGLDPAG